MATDEQRILLTQALPGMELSRKVVTQHDVLLCGAGQALDDELITKLMVRGIKRVFVKGHPLPSPDPSALKETLNQLNRRFSRVRHNYIMDLLHRLVETEITRRYR